MIAPRKIRNKWQARYRDADHKIRSAGIFETKKEALEATVLAEADTLRAKVTASAPEPDDEPPPAALTPEPEPEPERPQLTLAEYAPSVLAILKTSCQPGTLANHERNLRLHLLPTFGHMKLTEIRPDAVDVWWAERPATGWRRAAYFSLSRIMRMARKHGHIAVNPCQVEGSSADVSTPRPELTEEQAWQLIDALDPDMRAFVVVMFGGSLRIGEALGLSRAHVDLDTGAVKVERQFLYRAGEGEQVVHRTKTNKSRAIHLSEWALAELTDYLARRPPKLPSAALFTTPRGDRLTRTMVYTALHNARQKVGLDWVHAHDLRHSSLTALMKATGDLFAVMDRAGHDDIRSAKRYQHVNEDRQRNLAAQWGKPTPKTAAIGSRQVNSSS